MHLPHKAKDILQLFKMVKGVIHHCLIVLTVELLNCIRSLLLQLWLSPNLFSSVRQASVRLCTPCVIDLPACDFLFKCLFCTDFFTQEENVFLQTVPINT